MSESQYNPEQSARDVESGTQSGSNQPPPEGPSVSANDSKRKRWPVFALFIVVLALFLCVLGLIGLGVQEPGLTCGEPVRSQAVEQAAPTEAAEGLTYFANMQVILTGFQNSLDEVTKRLAEQGIQLRPLRDCDLGAPVPSPVPGLVSRPVAPWQRDPLKITLYEITSGQPVTQVILAVEAIIDPISGQPAAYADPNYKTVGTAAGPCGSPDSIGGSPDSIGGSPDGLPSRLTATDAQRLFREQWALEHIGLGPIPIYSTGIASLSYLGDGVRVGVFDTSPFGAPDQGSESQAANGSRREKIDWISPILTLTVENDSAYRSDLALGAPTGPDPDGVKQHGLFVAGLIHAIAPGSDIHLYPVLNESGCGDLYSLIAALTRFTAQVNIARRGMGLRGAVANLSLGVLKPMSESDTSGQFIPTEDLCAQLALPSEPCRELLDLLLKDRIEALQITVERAHDRGIVVVAAAGNGSGRDGRPVRPPDLPAAYPTVLGIAGSNANRQRSCFSNWGDVSAPAGEGAPGQITVISNTVPVTVTTSCAGSFETPLISLVLVTARFPLGYAKWNGTSFATPLVSGLAALALEAGVKPGQGIATGAVSGARLTPNQVAQAIKCGAATGDGVVNVRFTLVRCLR